MTNKNYENVVDAVADVSKKNKDAKLAKDITFMLNMVVYHHVISTYR